MATKAVCLLSCPGYDTATFLTTHSLFKGFYGQPCLIYTDHAPSLIKAAETPDWAEIAEEVGNEGTEWRLTAKGCSWRNGLAERVIRAARHTLGHVIKRGELLYIHQFGATLSIVSSIINSRPLSVRTSPDGDFHTISPSDVLLGSAGRSVSHTGDSLQLALSREQDITLKNVA